MYVRLYVSIFASLQACKYMVPDNPYGWVVMKWTRSLCGPASMSQNDFKTSETMQPPEASPVKPHMSVRGIDSAKRLFHVAGMTERGQIVLRKRLVVYLQPADN